MKYSTKKPHGQAQAGEECMKPVIIGIAGGTGSGKSTFTNRLKKAFGDNISVIYHDSYYKAHDDMSFEERKLLNYDHPDAFDTELMLSHIALLKEGHAVVAPTYDFANHNRAQETVLIEPRRVIIIEGILTLYDKRLRDMMDIKIFVDADADERILRRVIRDTKERGREVQNIVDQYLTTVKPMHYLYVEPTKRLADIVVNSGKNPVALEIIKNTIQSILDKKV